MLEGILRLIIGGIIFILALSVIGNFPYAAIVVVTVSIVALFLIFGKDEY